MKNLIYILLLALIVSCSTEVAFRDGSTIDRIEQNSIFSTENSVLELEPDSKTFFLIRHAEKDTLPKANPVLTEEGYQRAFELANIFKKSRLDKVYSTFFNRTMLTVDSVTINKGLGVKIYKPGQMRKLAEELKTTDTDKRYLIVGHSNTIPGMVNLLMGEKVIENSMDESIYDRFYVVTIPKGGEPKLFTLKYG